MLDRTVHVEGQLLRRAVLAVLRTRPPVGEEGEEVGCADRIVEVLRPKTGYHKASMPS